MIDLICRFCGLLIKFSIPISILLFSDETEMGRYYLYLSILTYFVMLGAMNNNIYFSGKYLQQKFLRSKKRWFTNLILLEILISGTLSLVILPIISISTEVSFFTLIMIPAFLISETCSTEISRFLWNIGEISYASKREVIRSLIYAIPIITSSIIHQKIMTNYTLVFMALLNIILILYDLYIFGEFFLVVKRFKTIKLHPIFSLLKKTFSISLPLSIHEQVIAANPLAERSIITLNAGLVSTASYSFHYSIIQTGASLFLMPKVSIIRKKILGSEHDSKEIYSASIYFFIISFLYVSSFSILAYIFIPFLCNILNKNIESSVIIIVGSCVAATVNSYSAVISPLFASENNLYYSNLMSILVLLPYSIVIYCGYFGLNKIILLIIFVSILQLLIRVGYFQYKIRSYK
jgi:hypothetical protein